MSITILLRGLFSIFILAVFACCVSLAFLPGGVSTPQSCKYIYTYQSCLPYNSPQACEKLVIDTIKEELKKVK